MPTDSDYANKDGDGTTSSDGSTEEEGPNWPATDRSKHKSTKRPIAKKRSIRSDEDGGTSTKKTSTLDESRSGTGRSTNVDEVGTAEDGTTDVPGQGDEGTDVSSRSRNKSERSATGETTIAYPPL